MVMPTHPKTHCRTPAEGRDGGTNIPSWKFDLLRKHILDIVRNAGEYGFPFRDLKDAIRPRLKAEDITQLGSLGWHTTTVKLEMEVRGEIARLNAKGPQLMVLGDAA